ncbi:MAG: TylF/MycF/NovP-related O-methyltransferase [Cyclobacteriaceae bacterium]
MVDYSKSFEHENNFYLTAQSKRMARLLAHYELYKMTTHLPGDIFEFGVFRGASFLRFIMFHQLFEVENSRRIIGFDTFGDFPSTNFEDDKKELGLFIDETGGGKSVSEDELREAIQNKNFKNYELVKGDILDTLPKYLEKHPEQKVSLLNIDTDVYEPAKCIIDLLADRVVKGGIIIFDDYGVFPGETKIADEYCEKHGFTLKKFPFTNVPSYLIK